MCPRTAYARSGTTTRSATTCSTSTCTWCTRSRARRPSRGCGSPAGRVRRPDRTLATADHNVPTWSFDRAGRGRALARAARGARSQLRRVRRPALRARAPAAGHRARDRPRARRDAAGHDDRLRRLPHLDARRLRRARVRHRHERGRARAGHADAAPAARADDARALRRAARARRRGQGPDPRPDRPDRHRRRHRPRHRVRRRGGPRALDGGPHDDLEHVDRGGRARRAVLAGRDDVAYLRGRPGAPRRLRGRPPSAGWPTPPTRARVRPRVVVVDVPALAPQVSWGTNPGQIAPITGRVPEPAGETDERALAVHGARGRHGRCRTSRSTASSSARARTAAWPTCAPPPTSCAASASPAACRRWSCRARWRSRPPAEAEGLDRVFTEAGFEWRNAGCSMCLGMNPDILQPGERCASTSNRNFEGRQGARRPHAPGEPRDGRGRGHRRPPRRREGVG